LEGFDHKDLLSLPFTVALLNEVFRLYPPHHTILRRTPCAVTIDLPATLPSPLPASALPSPTPRSLPDGQWRPITPRYTPSFARGTDRGEWKKRRGRGREGAQDPSAMEGVADDVAAH
jgi:hypothetical protein